MAHIDLADQNQRLHDVLAVVSIGAGSHWTATSADPNDPVVIGDRARSLAAAWRAPIRDRTAFIVGRAAGKNVLDIGCVAHDEERMNSSHWLHGHVAHAADSCLGVDILAPGVAAMRAAGFNAVVHDLSKGLGPVAEHGPFQVMIAGELIEHVGDVDMLFAAAADGLSADGELIITTPNPYAPARVRAGQRGDIWENVDHILYAFPSGIAELAERHGLILAEAATTTPGRRTSPSPLRWLKRTLKGSHWHRRGFVSVNQSVRPAVLDRLDWADRIAACVFESRLMKSIGARRRFVGETFVYVVARAPLD